MLVTGSIINSMYWSVNCDFAIVQAYVCGAYRQGGEYHWLGICLRVSDSSPNFTDVLADETDEKAIEFAMGGMCNCCAGML